MIILWYTFTHKYPQFNEMKMTVENSSFLTAARKEEKGSDISLDFFMRFFADDVNAAHCTFATQKKFWPLYVQIQELMGNKIQKRC